MKSLKRKILLIVIGAFILYGLADYAIQRFIVFPSFLVLERNDALTDLDRCLHSIQSEIEHLDSTCHDWAAWDDTYEFIETAAQDYIDANLVLDVFSSNKLNLVCFCDASGKVVWDERYDFTSGNTMAIEGIPRDLFPPGHPLIAFEKLLKQPLAKIRVSGIFMTAQGPMLVASRPILTSKHEGPIRGAVIMGRLLNEAMIQALGEQVQVDFTAIPIQPERLSVLERAILPDLQAPSRHFIDSTKADRLHVYKAVADISNAPSLLVRAAIPRNISAKGAETIRYVLYSVLVAAICMILVMLLLTDSVVLSPIIKLIAHAKRIANNGNLSARLSLERNDEIGLLAREFDNMLDKLEKNALELERANQALKTDMEKHRETLETLGRSEEKYRLLVENAQDGIFLLQDGCFRFANPSTLKILGYEKEILTTLPFDEIVHPDDRNRVLDCREKCLQGGKTEKYCLFRALNSRHELLWLQMTNIQMIWEEKPAVLCFIRDLTEAKQMESQLVRTQRLEAIGALAGGIAHDFNNILYPIVGYTEVAMRQMDKDSKARNYLQQVLAAAERAGGLVQQILTFSRRSEHEMKPMLLQLVVKEACKLIRATIPSTIQINTQINSNCGPILGNSTQLHQILMNLLTNAYHAMEEDGGILDVVLEETNIASDITGDMVEIPAGHYIRLLISDTGIGMSREVLEKIYDPFFTTKAEGKGTGLGLSVVHGIVKAHGGKISVTSEPGRGTCFTLYFTAIEKEAEDSADRDQEKLPGGNESILIVDDEPMIVEMEKEMLEDLGYRVAARTNSAEALEAIRFNPKEYDLVISDITMPNMTGDQLIQNIRAIRQDLPVILCTGFSEKVSEEKALDLGAGALIMKPINQRTLAVTIRNLLAGEHSVQ